MDFENVAELIEVDQSLSSQILRLANSAFYRAQRSVAQVTQALVMLGAAVTRSLVLSTSALDIRKVALRGFWEHSIGCAVAAVASDDLWATLRVADTGYGLSAHDLPELFTKYARFHQEKGIRGTGLGLYISKAMVEAHCGTIEVSSEPGLGSTFTVRLRNDTTHA